MASRLPVAPERIDDVARAALVCRQTVQRYRDGLHLLRATEAAITKAIRELPESPQLELEAGGIGCLTALASSVSLTKRPDCQVASIPAPPPTERPLRMGPSKCRVTVIMPEGCAL